MNTNRQYRGISFISDLHFAGFGRTMSEVCLQGLEARVDRSVGGQQSQPMRPQNLENQLMKRSR